jgi:predicted O-methyltransferase YrrM
MAEPIRSVDAPLGDSRSAGFAEYLALSQQIDGWFDPGSIAAWDALLGLQQRVRITGHLLEIGVWHGKSATLLARHADPRREICVLVDKFLDEAPVRAALALVRPVLDDSVRLLCIDSRRLLADPLLAEGFESFRWIHIDGEHTAGAVTSDLIVANALLAARGVVCIDDFFNWLYPQVTEAVLRYVRDNPDHFSLFLCGYNKAYLARPHYVHALQAFCKNELVGELEARGVEATVAKTTYPAEMNTFGMGPRFQDARLRGPDWDPKTIRV